MECTDNCRYSTPDYADMEVVPVVRETKENALCRRGVTVEERVV